MNKMKLWLGSSVAALSLLFAAGTANAYIGQRYVESVRQGGLGLEVGGGVYGFTGDLGAQAQTGGSWTGLAVLGPRSPLGLELSYTGAANSLSNTATGSSETIVSTIFEGNLRLNLLTDSWATPFLFGGVGWYNLAFDTDNVPGNQLNGDDQNAVSVPLGLGSQFFLTERWTAGLRFAYRIIAGADPSNLTDRSNTDSWEGVARIGAVF